jgi:hypothetical protein
MVFESVVSTAIVDNTTNVINVENNSILTLTPTYILVRAKDIANSVKIYNSNIQEIRIDEFQKIIIINNTIRIFNFYTNQHLQQFLVVLEYLMRNMAHHHISSNKRNTKPFVHMMRPMSWNDILLSKDRILFVCLNVNLMWSLYVLQNESEIENKEIDGALLTRSRSETRVEANFKFYKFRNKAVMDRLHVDSNDLDNAYFEVK